MPADLKTLGGLDPLVALLSGDDGPEVQAAAAYVVGTAGSNNHVFQEHLMAAHPGVLAHLLQVRRARGGGHSSTRLLALVAHLASAGAGMCTAAGQARGTAATQQQRCCCGHCRGMAARARGLGAVGLGPGCGMRHAWHTL